MTTIPERREITCADCGQPYATKRKNTKICAICRLAKNIWYVNETVKKCIVCNKQFCLTEQGETACHECDPVGSTLHGKETCAFCGAIDSVSIRKGVRVCLGCAQNPKHRERLKISLARKIKERRDQAGDAAAYHAQQIAGAVDV